MRKQNWRGDSEPYGNAVSGERVTGSWQEDRKAVKRASKHRATIKGSHQRHPWAR